MLAHVNKHERDEAITFYEPTHTYTVAGDRSKYTSCTTYNAQHFSAFDSRAVIQGMKQSARWPESKYYGMSDDEIVALWSKSGKEASAAGTELHYYIECLLNKSGCCWEVRERLLQSDAVCLKYIDNFIKANPGLHAYRTEWMIYNEDLKIAGSIDAVFRNPDGSFAIYDWKRSKEIKKTAFGNKWATTECISHLPDSNYWKYALQLNVYKAILEEKYGLVVSELYLVVFHPANKDYIKIKMPVLADEIKSLFSLRREQLV